MKQISKNILIFVAIFIAIAVVFTLSKVDSTDIEKIGLQKMITEINEEKIENIVVEKNELSIKLKDGTEQIAKKEPGQSLTEILSNFNVESAKMTAVNIEIKDESGMDIFLTSVLPFLLPFILIVAFLWFMMRGVQGANSKAMMFGQSQAREASKEDKVKTNFGDVAGAKEAKEELEEIIGFLKDPKKFTNLGARIPRGVLLLGSPGTGKTLLARAVAGEANVPFFSISGSEFVEMFVGVGASRVRDLFKKAKKNTPCIVFIDEIDAVGRKRGAGLGGSHDEREQTLNQILVEMDGFEDNAGVIVVAATNRPDVLDKALLRPGRFDRQIVIDVPDIADREAILKIHARKKPLDKDVDLRKIAERTPGFSGADLANVLNEAAILAASKNQKEIVSQDLFDSIEKVMLGPERKSRIITNNEKKITAYHEAGHALVAHYLPNTDPVHKISIIARGQAGGYTIKLPSEDKHMHTKTEFIEEVAVLLAGYLTEKEIFGEVTTGATSDLRRATEISRRLITDYGMSAELGPRTYGNSNELVFLGNEIHEQRDYSEKISERIDNEITEIINAGVEKASQVIKEHKDMLEKIVKVLLEKETIEKDEFDALMAE
ncbi:MAG: ATP-dependent zinc metalloprotease FtsH [bacterium]